MGKISIHTYKSSFFARRPFIYVYVSVVRAVLIANPIIVSKFSMLVKTDV